MLEGLYNILILAETGVFTYLFSKMTLDYAWMKTVQFAVNHSMMNDPNVKDLVNVFDKVDNDK